MILIQLPNSELKTILKKRKEDFNTYRISNGKYSVKTEDISDVIERLAKKESDAQKNEEFSNPDDHVGSEDTTKATQTYTEKIKGGYFGKRRSRF